MSDETKVLHMGTRVKLSGMMFLQFMLVAVFFNQLANYLGVVGLSKTAIAWIMSSMGIGCLFSPIVGMVADRHFASEKVLMFMNVVTGGLLLIAGIMGHKLGAAPLFAVMLLAMICYMPTWSLTNAIAMSHAPAESLPRIRVFGSIGWFASGAFTLVAREVFGMAGGIDATINPNIPLVCGGVVALVGAALAMTLPTTPPPAKGQPASIVDAMGLRALSLMKDFNFAMFVVLSFLVMMPFSLYWVYFQNYLAAQNLTDTTVIMNWGQFAEMFLMLLLPIAILKFGIKNTMLLGLVALVARFAAFWMAIQVDSFIPIYIGILVHGLIFGFFFVGGQIYIDKKAPEAIRGQAQGFIFLVTFGAGLLVGTQLFGYIREATGDNWSLIMQIATGMSVICALGMFLLFKDDTKAKEETVGEAKAEVEEALEESPEPAV